MTPRETEMHERRIAETLAQVAAKRGYRMDAVTTRTPLDDLLEKEAGVPGDEREEIRRQTRMETLAAMNRFYLADGPHPGAVLRRVFAILKAVSPELIWHMTLADLGQMFGETRAAQSWRVKKIFSEYQRERGVKGFKAAFQKSEDAVAAYARAQRGNSNRRAKSKLRSAA